MNSDFADFLVVIVALCGITWGVAEMVYNKPRVLERRVEVCSPRSVDAYSSADLRSIAAMRERLAKVRGK